MTGGGTAGHILPALELLRVYRREMAADGFFIGCAEGLESRIVPGRGERLEIVPGLPVARTTWTGKLAAIPSLSRGIMAARRLLRREGTQVVIGFGGYASFGGCLAARSLGLPVIVHEANAAPGLANTILGKIANRVCVGFEEAATHFAAAKVVHTGTPCSSAAPSRRSFDPPHRFLVLGGSTGSPHLNREAPRVFEILKQRGLEFSVRHIAGSCDVAAIEQDYESRSIEARVDSFVDDMRGAYAEADFAISCAGGLTLAELASAGLPALLVPLSSASQNHQIPNAGAYAAYTGVSWVAENEWNAQEQAEGIERMFAQPALMREIGARTLQWAVRDAAHRVIQVCEETLGHSEKRARSTARG